MAQKILVFGTPKYLRIYRAPRFKKGYGTMSVLPWDKDYGAYDDGASAAQLEVWARFAEVAHKTRGRPLHERLKIIAQELSVGEGGVASEVYGIPKETYIREKIEMRRLPPEVIRARISAWREKARAKVGEGPVATIGRRLEVAGL